jgi:hypothetical protein
MTMKTVASIINTFGGMEALAGSSLRVENGGYMPLVIESVGVGPRGLPLVSVAHYFEQNGDLMSDPEMTFEVDQAGTFYPISITQHPLGIYREAVFQDEQGRVLIKLGAKRDLEYFARIWDRNIKDQGFLAAAKEQAKARAAQN